MPKLKQSLMNCVPPFFISKYDNAIIIILSEARVTSDKITFPARFNNMRVMQIILDLEDVAKKYGAVPDKPEFSAIKNLILILKSRYGL